MDFWKKLMNHLGDFLWFTCFLLVGAGLTALIFLTYLIPKRDSLRELVRNQKAELLKARVAFEKERRDRILKEQQEAAARRLAGTGNPVDDANDIINGGKS